MSLKENLMKHCWDFVTKKEQDLIQISQALQESLNAETKSSAGDKHETGRAMVQLEQEKLGKQLFELNQMKQILQKVGLAETKDKIRLGSWVKTNYNQFFIAISAGFLNSSEGKVFCISAASPIGQLLLGKQKGETFNLNGKQIKILEVN
ncbi:GreA/GreB family elongation factor [Flagellimonas allohymeniacidonis]|uniref:3-oxoacyl-ACP synthase n=1 Tax=Flagellimonas allohymeniacidonis TaxID=2517819 RepID=A0A4Q8QHM2_9FLAO|nr:GreA/GreB family elongation factor [Allomuricauda hymeniacidonis]TAI47666.1 3-oxoacyl-ACP synthase [Allomuricauda hymeniacidonis]